VNLNASRSFQPGNSHQIHLMEAFGRADWKWYATAPKDEKLFCEMKNSLDWRSRVVYKTKVERCMIAFPPHINIRNQPFDTAFETVQLIGQARLIMEYGENGQENEKHVTFPILDEEAQVD